MRFFFVILCVASPALAEPLPPRQGLELGFGLWGGNLHCESEHGDCNAFAPASGLDFAAAYFFNESLAIAFDAWVMKHTENMLTVSQGISTLGVKWRPMPALTLQAGLGDAYTLFDFDGAFIGRSGDAPAIMAAVALDVVRARRWAISIEARAGTCFYGDTDNDGKADITAHSEALGARMTFFGF